MSSHHTSSHSKDRHVGLSDGYGVLVGTKKKFFRDDPVNFGRYHHGNLVLTAGGKEYRCAIDVDSGEDPEGHSWCTFPIPPDSLGSIRELDEGWHSLKARDGSGALDYIRSPELQSQLVWVSGDDKAAMAAVEAFVVGVGEGEEGCRYFVFGEPFTRGFGVHNIHQNQGSVIGGGHDAENGPWQDGAVLIERSGGSMVAFLNKFSNQADSTDDEGKPA